jgi:hypothetical protein
MTKICPHRRRGVRQTAALMIVTAVAGVAAADTPRIESAWSSEPLVIDAKLADWTSPLESLGSTKLSMGVRNDTAFLYIALAASDPSARMMLTAAGFTVWWDPAGKEKKAYGLTVPPVVSFGRGMRGRGPGGGPPDQGGQPPDWQGTPPAGQEQPPAGREGREGQEGGPGPLAIQPIRHIEVVGPGKDDRRRLELEYARTIGFDAAVRVAEGVLVYELRIPLPASEGQPYTVHAAPGATIGLGVETNQLERPGGRGEEGERGRGGGGRPGGGGGGMGGGMGGGGMMGGGGGHGMGGGSRGGGREGMSELKPIKQWTIVHLAKAPA